MVNGGETQRQRGVRIRECRSLAAEWSSESAKKKRKESEQNDRETEEKCR